MKQITLATTSDNFDMNFKLELRHDNILDLWERRIERWQILKENRLLVDLQIDGILRKYIIKQILFITLWDTQNIAWVENRYYLGSRLGQYIFSTYAIFQRIL